MHGQSGPRSAVAALCIVASGFTTRLIAQDTTQAYPWRISHFPYVTSSPNDGLMVLYRGVLFRQSRWNDRASIHDQVALEGGYSTKSAWLLRARGDFPRIGDGWRLQVIGEATRTPHYLAGNGFDTEATRTIGSIEVTRRIVRGLHIAARGAAVHVSFATDPELLALTIAPESDLRGRLALVYDHRNREYDTRSGFLLEGGIFGGTAAESYLGSYVLAKAWLPLSERTRLALRHGIRQGGGHAIDAVRVIPAWEDEFVSGGGPQSNRGLAIGSHSAELAVVMSAEVRHDVKVFPVGAIAVLGFVEATTKTGESGLGPFRDLTPTVGGGLALRLLRNAVLTATVGVAESKARLYISSGWSW